MYAGFAGAKTRHAPYLRPTGMWEVLEMQEQFPAVHVGKAQQLLTISLLPLKLAC